MRLIDADVLKERIISPRCNGKSLLMSLIDSMPTVDAVEVVKCEDRKYYGNQLFVGTQFEYGECLRTDKETAGEEYCSWAERKETEK